ncbi:MAG: tetratricopeptide repeat protein [Planctomycetota bacterium]|jgi:tetratricopeptide (TPR) repeat protein
MARRYFNWKLAIVLIVGVMVLGVTVYAVHQWQKETKAERGLELGTKAYDEERYEEAALHLGRYVGVYKDNIPAMLKYADAHLNIRPLKRNNVMQAIGTYSIILRQDPTNSEAARRLVELHLTMQHFGSSGEAERIAREFLDKTNDPEVRRLCGVALGRQRKYAEAIVEFRAVIAEEPNQIIVYEYLGDMVKQFPAAFAQSETVEYWYDEAVKKNPDSARAYISKAGFYLRTGEKEKALEQLEKAESLELSEKNVRVALVGAYLAAGLIDKAEEHLVAEKEKKPESLPLWNMWVRLAIRSNSKQKAIEVAEAGLESLSRNPWDFMPRATELFIMAGESERAAECIDELNKKDVNPSTVAGLRAMLAEQQGDMRAAARHWQQSIALGNKMPQAQLSLAAALAAIGDTESAMRQLETFLSQHPDSVRGLVAMAKLLVKTGDWAGVAENTRRALQLAPGSSEAALLNLQARVQLLAGDPSADEEAWDDIMAALAPRKASEGSAIQAGLLEIQIMIQREKFDDAEKLVAEMKKKYPSQYKLAMAEVGLLVARKEMDGAVDMLNRVIDDFPEVEEPVRYLALMLDAQGNTEKAEAVIKQALQRIKEPAPRLELGLLLTRLYQKWKRHDDSYAMLEQLSEEAPDSIPVKRMLLSTKPVAEDSEKARKLVDEIKAIEGEDGWQWKFEQAKIWFDGDEFSSRSAEIILLLKENLLANPDDQASRILLARTYQLSGRSETALATFREAIGRSPSDVQIIALTVDALFKAQEYEEAAEILNRISKQGLDSPQLKQLQFQSLVRRGELDSAADMLNKHLIDDPNNFSMGLSLALLKIQQNEFDEATKLLDQLSEKDPDSIQVLVARVQLHVREGKADEALKLCNQIIENDKTASAYIIRGRTLVSLGRFDEAGADYDRAVEAEPENPNLLATRSDFYSMTGQKDKAIADIEAALKLGPDNLGVQRRAIDLFLAAGSREKARQARAIIERSLIVNPEDSQLKFRKAQVMLAEGTAPAIRDAVKILEELTEENPGFAEARRLLARVLMRQGLTAKALDTILQGLVHNEKDKELLMLKAQAEASKSPFLAIATLKQLSNLDPNDINIALSLADAYIATGEPEKAESLIREHLLKCDDSYKRMCRTALAIAMYSNNKKTEAKAEFDALIDEEPNDPAAALGMVKMFEKDKLWDQIESFAVERYKKYPADVSTALAMAKVLGANEGDVPRKAGENLLKLMFEDHPNDVRIPALLAVLMQTQGRDDEAATFYRRVIEIKPDDVVSINNLAWIICESQGKHAEALELADKGLAIAPNYIDLIDTRGVAYYRMGKFDDAIKDFSECIRLYPEDTPAVTAAYFHLARALAKAERSDDAVQSLNKALKLNDKVGGLSPDDLTEANNLLEKLSNKGG